MFTDKGLTMRFSRGGLLYGACQWMARVRLPDGRTVRPWEIEVWPVSAEQQISFGKIEGTGVDFSKAWFMDPHLFLEQFTPANANAKIFVASIIFPSG